MNDNTGFILMVFSTAVVLFFLFISFSLGVSEGYKESNLTWQKRMIKAGCAEYNRTNGKFTIKNKCN